MEETNVLAKMRETYLTMMIEMATIRLYNMFVASSGCKIKRIYYDGNVNHCPNITSIERFNDSYKFHCVDGNQYFDVNDISQLTISTLEDFLSAKSYDIYDEKDFHYVLDYSEV